MSGPSAYAVNTLMPGSVDQLMETTRSVGTGPQNPLSDAVEVYWGEYTLPDGHVLKTGGRTVRKTGSGTQGLKPDGSWFRSSSLPLLGRTEFRVPTARLIPETGTAQAMVMARITVIRSSSGSLKCADSPSSGDDFRMIQGYNMPVVQRASKGWPTGLNTFWYNEVWRGDFITTADCPSAAVAGRTGPLTWSQLGGRNMTVSQGWYLFASVADSKRPGFYQWREAFIVNDDGVSATRTDEGWSMSPKPSVEPMLATYGADQGRIWALSNGAYIADIYSAGVWSVADSVDVMASVSNDPTDTRHLFDAIPDFAAATSDAEAYDAEGLPVGTSTWIRWIQQQLAKITAGLPDMFAPMRLLDQLMGG